MPSCGGQCEAPYNALVHTRAACAKWLFRQGLISALEFAPGSAIDQFGPRAARCLFAAAHPDDVSHLVMVNALYGTPGPWSMRARLEDRDHPGQLSPSMGAYNLRDSASLLGTWDANIPVPDKASWREPAVAEAYASIAIASDPTSSRRSPPSVRVPNGPLRDSYTLASGTPLWRASDIRAATLVVRGELDFWSRSEDVQALQRELTRARRVETVTLPGATHLVFLDRPEHGRAQLIPLLLRFLDERADIGGR